MHLERDKMETRLLIEENQETASTLASTRCKRSRLFTTATILASATLLGLIICLLVYSGFNTTFSIIPHLTKPRHLRILPLGDSITWGGSGAGENGYRLDLLNMLEKEGFYVTYVGSQASGTMEQNHHDGWPGATIVRIQELGLATINGTINPPPNLVMLMAGTNNLLAHNQTAMGMTAELEDLLDDIFAFAPDVCVVLSQIIGCACGFPELDMLHAYNKNIAEDIVPRFRSKGLRVVMVSEPSIDMAGSDGVHPVAKGYAELAEAFSAGILEAASTLGFVRDTV